MYKYVSAAVFFLTSSDIQHAILYIVAAETSQNDSVYAEVLPMFNFHFSCIILDVQAVMTYIYSCLKSEFTQHRRILFTSQRSQKLILTCVWLPDQTNIVKSPF